MKKIIALLMMVFISGFVFGQNSVATSQTALTLPKGRVDFGLLHPMAISISDNVDLITHPLLDILLPNIGVKVNWMSNDGFYLSTQHRLSYATLLLNTISNPGTGGVLPADSTIPQVFTLDNRVLATYQTGIHVLSLLVGAKFAAKFPNEEFATIDYPLIFTNTAAYHAPVVFNIEANYRLLITKRFLLLFDGGIYLMPQPLSAFEIRQTTEVLFSFTRFISATAGYLLTYGHYPYGNDWKVFPLVDIVFSFGGER